MLKKKKKNKQTRNDLKINLKQNMENWSKMDKFLLYLSNFFIP